jgi:DNA ligase-1
VDELAAELPLRLFVFDLLYVSGADLTLRPYTARPARVRELITPSVWVAPQVVIEVLADEITRSPMHTCGMRDGESGYALRFARLISFRDADKRPEDATTVAEVIALYAQQGRRPAT